MNLYRVAFRTPGGGHQSKFLATYREAREVLGKGVADIVSDALANAKYFGNYPPIASVRVVVKTFECPSLPWDKEQILKAINDQPGKLIEETLVYEIDQHGKTVVNRLKLEVIIKDEQSEENEYEHS